MCAFHIPLVDTTTHRSNLQRTVQVYYERRSFASVFETVTEFLIGDFLAWIGLYASFS